MTGEILSVKEVDSPYGWTTKVRVRTDYGATLWGTLPASLDRQSGSPVGKRVAFTATVKQSDGDETFGFFSRPTKARYL